MVSLWTGFASQVLHHPHALTLFEDSVYWTDRGTHKVMHANKWHGRNQSVVMYSVHQPLGIIAIHPSRQPSCKCQKTASLGIAWPFPLLDLLVHRRYIYLSQTTVPHASPVLLYCSVFCLLQENWSFVKWQ